MIRPRQSNEGLFCWICDRLESATHVITTPGAKNALPVCQGCLASIALDVASLTVGDLEDAQRIAAGVA